ncbi:hypothetical protein BH11PLA2_BH11PLA2_20900 [soil metagenome]
MTNSSDSSHGGAKPPPLRLVPATCCLCRVEDTDPVAVGADFEYRTAPDDFLAVRCRRCRLVYLNPRPAAEESNRIYPEDYHAFQFRPSEYGLIYRVRRRLEAKRVLGWCRGLPPNAKILDVGCGDGFHLGLLKEFGSQGWQLEGVDADPRAVAPARQSGLTIHQGSVEDLGLPSKTYHLILMIMTVEHLPDPLDTLRTVEKLLAPGGRLVIVTDNTGSPDHRFFGGRHWGGYHFPRHTYLFGRKSLAALGMKAGLEVERIQTAMSPVNWVYSFRNWLVDWGGPGFLVRRLSLKSALGLGVFTMVDAPLALIGYGAILHGMFRKPLNRSSIPDHRSFLKKLLDGPFKGPHRRIRSVA